MFKKIVFLFSIILFTNPAFAGSTVHHKLTVKINPALHSIEAVDIIQIPAAQAKSKMSFILNADLKVLCETPGVKLTLETAGVKADDLGMDREDLNLASEFKQNKYTLTFPGEIKGDVTFTLKFSGKINYQIKQIGEEYARGFSQTPGIIDEKGVYLGGSTYWVPWFDESWISFELTTTMPKGWSVVSQGNRTLNELKNEMQASTWNSPEPMEEVYLIAAKFTEYAKSAGSIDVMAFLRTPDESLANKYLETTAQYLEMYRKLVGPYPFTKFALVENFWETGYGMPSFTLLGEQVIRFPFILHSSYPHELLHNYWGNSAYVDFKTGNWCEGLTAYMADHLIAEQRGQADEYRRTTLQKFTDYVTPSNDFPLNKFISRNNPSSEAIGYGKNSMLWNMLREMVGDELFIKGFQKFYRDNKFKSASYDDIRTAFESVSGKNLKSFFDQWVNRKGAPELSVSNVRSEKSNNEYHLRFTLKQLQSEEAFALDVPVAISFAKNVVVKKVTMTGKEENYDFKFPENPLLIQIDPQFNLFRKLNYNEIPPSLSKIFGSEDPLILLPSNTSKEKFESYQELAKIWSDDKTKKIEVSPDSKYEQLPADKSIWIFGAENKFAGVIKNGLKDYDCEIKNDAVVFGKTSFQVNNNSFIISVRHPENPDNVMVYLSTENNAAVPGLSRKLPHYGKYSYLVFEGDEPANIGRGEWGSVNSPLTAKIVTPGEKNNFDALPVLPRRKALANLTPVFSAERMIKTVQYLSDEKLSGRAPGTPGINTAADYIADKFKSAGLLPGADDGSYFQIWNEVVDAKGAKAPVKNVIGIIPGTNPDLKEQSVIVCAHYDHLGLGWPSANKGNEGKIHPGADDNASGISVILELAELLGKSMKPQRTVIFVAFTSEESGLLGSKYYVQNMKNFPAKKVIGVLNFDTVGRLGNNKLLVIGASSAREWRFIFMGASYVTGVETEMVTQDLDASDQKSFLEAGVPGVQFFSGANSEYHRPSDTADKIDGAGLIKVAAIGQEALMYLADRVEPLTFQGPVKTEHEKSQQAPAGERRVSTGSVPDFTFSGEGVKIADLAPDSPAGKAGLQKGDVIVKLGEFKVANLKDYSDALKSFKPGDVEEIIFARDGVEKKTKIEFGSR